MENSHVFAEDLMPSDTFNRSETSEKDNGGISSIRAGKSICTRLIDALRNLGNSKGSSVADIQKYLSAESHSADTLDLKNVKFHLKRAADKGLLLKLDSGKYKINETARRKRSSSRSRKGRGSRKKRGSKSRKRKSRSRKRSGARKRSRSPKSKRSGSKGKRSGSKRRRRKQATLSEVVANRHTKFSVVIRQDE